MPTPPPASFFNQAIRLTLKHPSLIFHGISTAILHFLLWAVLFSVFFSSYLFQLFTLSTSALFIFPLFFISFILINSHNRIHIIASADSFSRKKENFGFSVDHDHLLFFRFISFEAFLLLFISGLIISFFSPTIFLLWRGLSNESLWVFNTGLSLFLPFFILAFFTRQYGRLYLTLAQTSILEATDHSLQLLRKHPKESFSFAIQSLLLRIFSLLFLTLGSIGYISTLSSSFIQGFFPFTLLIICVLYGWYETWIQIAWTLFFKEIAGPRPTDEDIPQKSMVILQEKGVAGLDQA